MCKNIIISILGAALLIEIIPWSEELTAGARIAIETGWTSTLIIFCLFCDEMAAKWRNHKERVARLREIMNRLAGQGGRTVHDRHRNLHKADPEHDR